MIYAQYLTVTYKAQTEIWAKPEYKLKLIDHPDYLKELNLLIVELNKLQNLIEDGKEVKVKETIYYWLGVFHYQLNDIATAVDNLVKAIEINDQLKTENRKDVCAPPARHLLGHIWNHSCHPSWWRWWFCSPAPLAKWWKRGIGGLLLVLTASVIVLPFIQKPLLHQKPLSPTFYIIAIVVFLLVLFSPLLTRFRAGEFEVEITPTALETPSLIHTMESTLEKAEKAKSPSH